MTHTTEQTDTSKPERIGIVAGWGSFPMELARHLRNQGAEVFVVAIKHHAAPEIETLATGCRWTGVLKIGASIRYLQSQGVERVAFAGKIFKERILYHGRGWIEHMPDFTCIRILGSSFITHSKDGRDDTTLGAIVSEYERRGIQVLPITQMATHLLATEGCLTRSKLNRRQEKDVAFGWEIARQMGGLDIGQSITVKDQMVLGVEAIEGTDALISRTQTVCPRGGFTLVKVAKPNQDMRFDVPTIGPQTIERLARAGGRALAVEAERTIIVELERTIALANKHSIAIQVMPRDDSSIELAENAGNNIPSVPDQSGGLIVSPPSRNARTERGQNKAA